VRRLEHEQSTGASSADVSVGVTVARRRMWSFVVFASTGSSTNAPQRSSTIARAGH
jgi:hypothetical protein